MQELICLFGKHYDICLMLPIRHKMVRDLVAVGRAEVSVHFI